MTDRSPPVYQIPSADSKGRSAGWILLALGTAGAAFAIWANEGFFLFVGLSLGFILTVVVALVKGSRYSARRKSIWQEHNYAWYRATFPVCAHPNGHLTCRFCGSNKSHVKNLMRRTYVRLHSCGQCGETLYFSNEVV